MRSLRFLLPALVFLAAPSAVAATLPYVGTLTISIRYFGVSTAPIVQLSATGVGIAQVNDSGGWGPLGSLSIAGSTLATTGATLMQTDPSAGPVGGMQLTVQNAPGTFIASGSGFGGIMPLDGAAKLCLFGPCSAPAANVSVPLSVVGVGGTGSVASSVNVTVTGAPWTTGAVPFGTLSAVGFAHGPVSGTSSTASPGGVVRLVTPIVISTNIPPFALLPATATFDIAFVPEPTTLLLLAGGMAILLSLGRERI